MTENKKIQQFLDEGDDNGMILEEALDDIFSSQIGLYEKINMIESKGFNIEKVIEGLRQGQADALEGSKE